MECQKIRSYRPGTNGERLFGGRHGWLSVAIIAAVFFCSLGTVQAAPETIRLTLLTGTPETLPSTRMLKTRFIPEVNSRLEKSGDAYRIEWKTVFGTVAGTGDTLEALEAGVGDIGVIIPPFEPSKLSLYLVSYVAPFSALDAEEVERAVDHVYDTVPSFTDQWEAYNLVPLTVTVSDSYQLFTNRPVRSLADLQGMKIASPSSAATWLAGTGAVHVQDESANYYNSVKTGVYDGFLYLVDLAYVLRLYEVVPYMAQVDFGPMYMGGVVVNRKRWLGFPPEVRQAITEAADIYAEEARADQQQRRAHAEESLREAGVKIHVFSIEERRKWASLIPNVASIWARRLERYGLPGDEVLAAYMESLRDQGTSIARNWDTE